MKNPQEEYPVDELITSLNVSAIYHPEFIFRGKQGWWKVEVKGHKNFPTYTRNLTKTVSIAIAALEEQNDELLQGEKAWFKHPERMREALRGVDHEGIQREKRLQALKKKWPSVSPSETMTPNRSII